MKLIIVILSGISVLCPAQAQRTADKPEFEAASIKVSPPPEGPSLTTFCAGGPGTVDPIVFKCENVTLSTLLTRAYGLSYFQLSGPDWLNKQGAPMFSVNASIPPGATKEQFNFMLQNLLAERFRMVLHREQRESMRYDLTVTKTGPRLKESTPPQAQRAGGLGAVPNGRSRLYRPEMTMPMLASYLSSQLKRQVSDATGLQGKYEVMLLWSPETVHLSNEAPGSMLAEALEDQLGLRLESKRGPVDFVVIDKTEKLPTEN